MEDVALRAGVSVATVSRVLNQPDRVSDDVLEKVRTAIRALGYIPNGLARALASKTTRTVGAVVPTISGAIYSEMVTALQQSLERHGFVLFVATHEYSLARELESVRALIERGVDALILVGQTHKDEVFDQIRRKQIPLVLMCVYDPKGEWSTVGWNNKTGGMRIAGHLAQIGHRRIGIIGGIVADNDRAKDRVDGFIAAFNERGIDIGDDYIVECPYNLAESARALRQLMALPLPPTAILCGNDVLATGALLECLRLGIRVPHDLSITGYDDLDLAAHLVPSLTTLRIPADEIGRLSARTLIGLIENNATPQHVDVDVDLILRETSGSAPAKGITSP
jgi:LacI family transcriptional regulator